jgi:hypothetical protein
MYGLKMPDPAAGSGVKRDQTFAEEIGARPMASSIGCFTTLTGDP